MNDINPKVAAVIVAHPDDETLWAGGTILIHPSWKWFILSLTRKSDAERANKFYRVLKEYGAKGIMGDLDDGPEQIPLEEKKLEEKILQLLPSLHYDLVISHDPGGEYTKHLRHEETGKAVITLWDSGQLSTKELWTFAYEDGGKKYLPKAIPQDTFYQVLDLKTWEKKYKIITEIFGFANESWEAKTTPREESFRKYANSSEAMRQMINKGKR